LALPLCLLSFPDPPSPLEFLPFQVLFYPTLRRFRFRCADFVCSYWLSRRRALPQPAFPSSKDATHTSIPLFNLVLSFGPFSSRPEPGQPDFVFLSLLIVACILWFVGKCTSFLLAFYHPDPRVVRRRRVNRSSPHVSTPSSFQRSSSVRLFLPLLMVRYPPYRL